MIFSLESPRGDPCFSGEMRREQVEEDRTVFSVMEETAGLPCSLRTSANFSQSAERKLY